MLNNQQNRIIISLENHHTNSPKNSSILTAQLSNLHQKAHVQSGNVEQIPNNPQQVKHYHVKINKLASSSSCGNLNNGVSLSIRPQSRNNTVKYYREAIPHTSQKVYSYFELAQIYYIKKNYTQAMKYFDLVIKMKLGDVFLAYYHKGTIQRQFFNQLESSQFSFQKSIQLNPGYIESYKSLASLYCHQNRIQQGQQTLKKFHNLFPENIDGLDELGKFYQCLYNSKKSLFINKINIKKAKEMYKKILEKNPNNAMACTRLGDLYLMSNQFKRAEHHYKIAISMDNRLIKTQYQLALIYQREKRFQEGLKLLEYCCLIEPNQNSYKEARAKNLELMKPRKRRLVRKTLSMIYEVDQEYIVLEQLIKQN